jgi:hypothetical protein
MIEEFKPKGMQIRHYLYIAGLIKLSGFVIASVIILT